MRLTISSPIRFVQTADGTFWGRQEADGYDLWSRYLDVFDDVSVLGRVRLDETRPAGWVPVCGPGVGVTAVPDYVGPFQLLRNGTAVRHAVEKALSGTEALILRVPCTVGVITQWMLNRRRPYAVEVCGDPGGVFAANGIDYPMRPFWRWLHTGLQRRICREATGCSYVTREALQRRYPARPGAMSSHYSHAAAQVEAAAAVRRSDATQGRFRLIQVGTLEYLHKAPDVTIRALALCRARGLDVEVAFAGDGQQRHPLEQLAAELRISPYVRFLGQLAGPAEVAGELNRADLFVLPSRSEGLPRAMVEAMARGLPCIATSVGGIPELLPPDCMVPPDDPEALAALIHDVAANPDRLRRMSGQAIAVAREYAPDSLRRRRNQFYEHLREVTAEWLECATVRSPTICRGSET